MRISDWSSDVCSSDLIILQRVARGQRNREARFGRGQAEPLRDAVDLDHGGFAGRTAERDDQRGAEADAADLLRRLPRYTRDEHGAFLARGRDRLEGEARGIGAFDQIEQPFLARRMGEGEAVLRGADEARAFGARGAGVGGEDSELLVAAEEREGRGIGPRAGGTPGNGGGPEAGPK